MSDPVSPGAGGQPPVSPGDPQQRSAAGVTPATAPVRGYAEAILTVARAEGVSERVEDDLFQFARTLEANNELRDRLTDPGLDAAAKLGVVEDLLAGKAHAQTLSAVLWVVQAGRARQVADIADEVARLGAHSRNRVVAEIRSAVALDGAQQRRLAEALSAVTGQEVETRVVVDPGVVGGLVAKVGDTVIDGSISRRLTELRSRLTGA